MTLLMPLAFQATTRYWRIAILLAAFALLQACGFHLRGAMMLQKIKQIYIDNPKPYTSFGRSLLTKLHASGMVRTECPEQAQVILKIFDQTFDEHNVFSALTNSQTVTYQLIYAVKYQFLSSKGGPLTPIKIIRQQRTETLTNNQYTGDSIIRNIENQMQENVIHDLLTRLQSKKISNLIHHHAPQA